jgi:hypothetical protein
MAKGETISESASADGRSPVGHDGSKISRMLAIVACNQVHASQQKLVERAA